MNERIIHRRHIKRTLLVKIGKLVLRTPVHITRITRRIPS